MKWLKGGENMTIEDVKALVASVEALSKALDETLEPSTPETLSRLLALLK
jgi:hypothetical protein